MHIKPMALCVILSISIHGLAAQASQSFGGTQGSWIGNPQVLDLSSAEPLAGLALRALSVMPLDADAVEDILSKPDADEDSPSQLRWLDEDLQKAREQERVRIAADAASVVRTGNQLELRTRDAGSIQFTDTSIAAKPDAEGDDQSYVYAGRMGDGAYYRVEWRSDHDAPGSLLINADSGAVSFVHNGANIAQPAPDGHRLLSLDRLNAPYPLAIVNLEAKIPHMALVCMSDSTSRIAAIGFKGWRDASSFELSLTPADSGLAQSGSVALRLTLRDRAWQLAASDPQALKKLGYTCRQS